MLGRLGFDLFKEESASGSVIFINGITSIAIRPCATEEQGAAFDCYRVGLHRLALRAARRDDVGPFGDALVQMGDEGILTRWVIKLV